MSDQCSEWYGAEFCKEKISTIECSNRTEYFITINRMPGQTSAIVFERAAQLVKQSDAKIVSMDVFGLNDDSEASEVISKAMGEVDWPVMWLKQDEDTDLGGVMVWAVSGVDVKRVQSGKGVLGSFFEDDDASYCRIAGAMPTNLDADRPAQAAEVFENMQQVLEECGMSINNVPRTWFFNDDILGWYAEFNATRDAFFRKHGVFDGVVPASTGIGASNLKGAALSAGLMAVKPKRDVLTIEALPSPLQCPALDYGSSFSRAALVETSTDQRIYISGTASIEPGGDTAFLDDTEKQIELTMDVAQAILTSRGLDWCDVVAGMAYVKYAKDAPLYTKYLTRKGLADFPCVLTNNTVCRDNLLFEIEAIAVKKK